MKVWLVELMPTYDEGPSPMGIFATPEAAREWIDAQGRGDEYEMTEYTVRN